MQVAELRTHPESQPSTYRSPSREEGIYRQVGMTAGQDEQSAGEGTAPRPKRSESAVTTPAELEAIVQKISQFLQRTELGVRTSSLRRPLLGAASQLPILPRIL